MITYSDIYPNCEGCPIKEFCNLDYVNSAYACESLEDSEYPLWEQNLEKELSGEWDD